MQWDVLGSEPEYSSLVFPAKVVNADSSIKSDTHLLTLEALYIRELKPYLNTQNAKEQDFKSRQLRISFWIMYNYIVIVPMWVHHYVEYSL